MKTESIQPSGLLDVSAPQKELSHEKQEFETLVKNAIAWAQRRDNPIEAIDFLAGSGMVVPSDMPALHEAKKRLSHV